MSEMTMGERITQLERERDALGVTAQQASEFAAELAVANQELVEALRYIQISTAPDGQWADQAVKSFVDALLSRHAPKSERT